MSVGHVKLNEETGLMEIVTEPVAADLITFRLSPEAAGSSPWSELAMSLPRIDEYFGHWAISEQHFRAAASRFQGYDLFAHARVQLEKQQPQAYDDDQPAAAYDPYAYSMAPGGIAVIEASGPMMKFASSLAAGTSTVRMRRQMRNALNDEAVNGILLHIDSPGGTVSGTKDLADDVAQAAKRKPVYTFFEDLGASAAYWVGSQASKVFTNPTGIVGSIGTYMVIEDLSGMAQQMGVKIHVIRAGEFKGAGTPGTEITDAQLAEWQRVIDALNDQFIRGVAQGRGLSLKAVRELADGRAHVGAAAAALSLVDGVQSFDATLDQLARASSKSTARSKATMSAATYQELKAGLPGANAEFICSQQEAGATLADAQAAWMKEQNARIEKANADRAKAEEEAAAAKAKPGVKALGGKGRASSASEDDGADADDETGDPIGDFNAAVTKAMAGGADRHQAVAIVAKKQPALHKAFLLATNPDARDEVEKKFR